MWKEKLRKFDTWATRDISTGKLEYSNYIHPLCDYSFSAYMRSKQIIWDEYRRGDNWQKWIPAESLFDSLIRHTETLKLLRKWYMVIETRKDWVIDWIVTWKTFDFDISDVDDYDIKDIETELNAIRFNSEALKLSIIKNDW